MRYAVTFAFLIGSPVIDSVRAADADLAAEVVDILEANCHRCHGHDGAVEGGFNYVRDLGQLVARGKIVPGKADRSPLFRRVADGTMPPEGAKPQPTEAEIARLREWIDAGAPGIAPPPERAVRSAADVHRAILADLESMPPRARRFQRFFTLNHFADAGHSDDQLRTVRAALNKLVNSLSWHPDVRNPAWVDDDGTVLRIDLRWYMWDAVVWNRMLELYPYGLLDESAAARAVSVETLARIPVVRGDWFVATASRPPLYQEILRLPASVAELERELRIDSAVNITQDRVRRAGFNGSGISRNNRILERHDSVHGYYWRSYDFDAVPENLTERGLLLPDQRNVFAYPLGPGNVRAENTFLHAGGEMIFQLPNGLQGYMLADAVGRAIDKAPVQIVSDPQRPDKAVELGVSCMGCHASGILPKADQVRDHVARNPGAFTEQVAELVEALYPPAEETLDVMRRDSEAFLAALDRTDSRSTRTEPVMAVTLLYEADLDVTLAAAEVGMSPERLRGRIAAVPLLERNLGALLVPGGTVSRPVWVQGLGDLVREAGLGVLFAGNPSHGTLPDNTGDLDPLETLAGGANGAAFSADGRSVIVASPDRSARLREVVSGRNLKSLVGHTASVWSVALSSDGRRALSGGMDATVRLWDLELGRELARFDDHRSVVTALDISADGSVAVSGGLDGRVIVHDLASGSQRARFGEPLRHVHAVALSPAGTSVLVAADDQLLLWDWDRKRVIHRYSGHTAEATTVAFSPDGRHFLSGGDDGVAILWDVKKSKPARRFEGHIGYVKTVAYSPDGSRLLTGGSDRMLKLWDAQSGRDLATFDRHPGPVVRAAFTTDGRQTVSIDRGGIVKIWTLPRD